VLIYAVFASLWILVSDQVLVWLVHASSLASLASILKGWFFVAVTSVLLYALLYGFGPLDAARGESGGSRWTLVLVLLTMLLGAGAVGYGLHQWLTGADGLRRDAPWLDEGVFSGLLLPAVFTVLAAVAGFVLWRQRRALDLAHGIQRDQAERLRTHELLAAIADNSEDAIFAKDVEGRYILFNRAASRFIGQPPEAVLGRDDRAIFPREQAELLLAVGREVLASRGTITREEVLSTPDGIRVFHATKGPLRDDSGRVVGLFGISRDITRDKEAEVEWRASEARFRALFDHAPVSILILDRETGELVDANRRALLAHGCASLEELRQEPLGGDTPRESEEALRLIRKTATDGPQRLEWMSRDRSGRIFWEEVLLSAIRLNGVERVMMIGLDITERKAAEDVLARNFSELKRFNRATVGRELAMIELKREVNALARELGREAPYPLAFMDAESPREAS
jgi:PAS domain S-box-containing protein